MTLAVARAERDAAIEAVDADWLDEATAFVRDYLATHETFFPEDIWDAGLSIPRDRRQFGAVVMRARMRGWVEWAGELRPRKFGHATAGKVWRSLIYKEGTAP